MTYLEYHHGEEVYVGELAELVDEVLGEEVEHRVLARDDVVQLEQLPVLLDLIDEVGAQGLGEQVRGRRIPHAALGLGGRGVQWRLVVA